MPNSIAAASAIALLLAAPALAQHAPGSDDDTPDRSIHLELGGGWMLSDPLGADDLEGPSGPTIDVALTRWTDRTGLVVGVMTIFGEQEDFHTTWEYTRPIQKVIVLVPHVYPHVGWRRRWMNPDGSAFVHVGIGGGPLVYRDRIALDRYLTSAAPLWHVEVMGTRAIRGDLSLRLGFRSIQWLVVPVSLQATAEIVWTF